MTDSLDSIVRKAALAVSRAGLADAFGFVVARDGADVRTTSAIPLVETAAGGGPLITSPLDASELPVGAPRELWLALALMATDPAREAVVRAQPRSLAAFASLRLPLPLINGHAAMLGAVTFLDAAIPVRDRPSADQVIKLAGASNCIILRGNGAVATGASVAEAVARMWVLETTAAMALQALAAGEPAELSPDEAAWWRDHAPEILPRMYRYLAGSDNAL